LNFAAFKTKKKKKKKTLFILYKLPRLWYSTIAWKTGKDSEVEKQELATDSKEGQSGRKLCHVTCSRPRASQDPKNRLPAFHTNWGCPPEERHMLLPFFLAQSKETESGLFSMSKSIFKEDLCWAWWHTPEIPADQEVEKADHEFKASPGKVSSETLSQKQKV
jgi:hypothetical protein